jgi:hypothetical protein
MQSRLGPLAIFRGRGSRMPFYPFPGSRARETVGPQCPGCGTFMGSVMQSSGMQAARAPAWTAAPRLSAEDAILDLLLCPDGQTKDGRLNFGAPINGRTRLMKELFLVSTETEAGRSGLLGFEFTPGPYGPSSVEVQHELDRLTGAGVVEQERTGVQEGVRLGLTPAGYPAAVRRWHALTSDAAGALYSIKSQFNATPYAALLYYVYASYPQFSGKSRIREEILGTPE